MKQILICFAVVFSFLSCQKEDDIPNDFSSVFGIQGFESAKEQLGEYAIFGYLPNGGMTVHSSLFAYDEKTEDLTSIVASFLPDKTQLSNRSDGGTYIINDQQWIFQGGGYMPANMGQSESEDFALGLFGGSVEISLENNGETVVSSTLVVPDRLTEFSVSNTSVIDPPSEVRWLSPQNATIRWNADGGNQNGVLLVLSSQRDKVNEITNGNKETLYMASLIQEDDGEYTVPNSFFDGLEANETLTLTLYRGKFDYIENDGEGNDFKFYALSSIYGQYAIK